MPYKLQLKELREAKGMSQRALAAAIGVTAGAVCQWEAGQATITLPKLMAAARVLECGLDDLVTWADSPPPRQ